MVYGDTSGFHRTARRSARRNFKHAMVVRPLSDAVRLTRLQAQCPSCRCRGIFQRTLKPCGKHVTDAPPSGAFVVDKGGVVDPHACTPRVKIDVIRFELTPPALGETPHVML